MTFLPLLLRFWWAPAIALALALALVQTARLDHAKSDLATARRDLVAMTSAKAASEGLRSKEAGEATEAYEALQANCTANFQAALSKGRIIERIVNAPPKPDGSRGLVDASSLRALVGQETEPVGAGGEVLTGGIR